MRRGKSNSKEEEGGSNPYESSIKSVATVTTVEEFWETYDYLVRPNDLPSATDYHFFREGIKPTWEDPSNARGGKWIVRLRKGLSSRYWEEGKSRNAMYRSSIQNLLSDSFHRPVLLALIGGQFPGVPEGEICGAVVSIRYTEDILGVWNKNSQDRDMTEKIRDAIKRVLQLPSHAHMVCSFDNTF
jgi:translation initiation factor 4E